MTLARHFKIAAGGRSNCELVDCASLLCGERLKGSQVILKLIVGRSSTVYYINLRWNYKCDSNSHGECRSCCSGGPEISRPCAPSPTNIRAALIRRTELSFLGELASS